MLTETYGGKCPNCDYDRMLMRYGSFGYFQYDGCQNCGFAFGTSIGYNNEEITYRDWEIWEGELNYLKSSLEEKNLPVSLLGILLYIEDMPEIKGQVDSVFDYSKWRKEEWQIDHKNKKLK